MAELQGMEFLRKNVIEGKKCRLESNFAFISYAHDDDDEKIVRNVFNRLYDLGYNLWIDTANIPKNENSWKEAAQDALMNEAETCKVALFFRSEESMIRMPIFEELEMIKELQHIHRIITVDIWHDDKMTAEDYGKKLIREKRKVDLNIYKKICTKVDVDSSVFRIKDVNSSLEELVREIGKELEKDGVKPQSNSNERTEEVVSKDSLSNQNCNVRLTDEGQDNLASMKDEKIVKTDIVGKEGYSYTIFGKEYQAGKREQGKLMYDAYSALVGKYPEKAEELTARTSIARVESVTNANTQDAKPPYFRTCQKFTVANGEYYVGTSYGFEAKIAEIKGMFKICGEDASEFILNGEPLVGKTHVTVKTYDNCNDREEGNTDCFEYKLWNNTYTANKLSDMMHNVFDMIAQKYPEKIDGIAHDESITSVALKIDVDGGRLPVNKLNYFMAKKEHEVDGVIYYVSTRYNREQGIVQLERMISYCEGTSDSFQIVSAPDKSTHSSNGKKGIGELL